MAVVRGGFYEKYLIKMELGNKLTLLLCGASLATIVYLTADCKSKKADVMPLEQKISENYNGKESPCENYIKKPKIFLNVVIDTNTKHDISYFNEVLAMASDNLYNNFCIALEWKFSYIDIKAQNSRQAIDNIGPQVFTGKGAYLIFLEDGPGGIASKCKKKMAVDVQESVECTANATLHELGHLLGLTYNSSDHVHLSQRGYIMSPHFSKTPAVSFYRDGEVIARSVGKCNLQWHPETRRQIIEKLDSGGLGHILAYQ